MLVCNLVAVCLIADTLGGAGAAAGAGFLLGWLLLHLSRRQDRKNFVFARAPQLPVKVLAEHDDAWIRGVVACSDPLYCPHFDLPCVFYDYLIERKVTRTRRDSKGRTRTSTSWVTDFHERRAVHFELVDVDEEGREEARITVLGDQAEFQHMPHTGTDYTGFSRRHSASYLQPDHVVTALGVKLENDTFSRYQEVPLLITSRTPEAFLAGSDSSERWLRRFGFVFLFLGGGIAVLFLLMGRLQARPNEEPWMIAGAVLGGLVFLSPFWGVSTYNRMVRNNQQCEAAWRQIDVDMLVRDRLIPNLVTVVQGYRDHEGDLFEMVAKLRTGGDAVGDAVGDVEERIHSDALAAKATKQLLALKENYPDLKANENFLKLHDQLWALEEKIAAARSFYNELATEWNVLVQSFPSMLVAAVCRYKRRERFRLEA